jgi:hypothetical protein
VKCEKNAYDTHAMLSEAYGREGIKKSQVLLSVINGSNRAHILKSQMKTMLITFFNIKGTICFEFIPQAQTVNQAYLLSVNIKAVT